MGWVQAAVTRAAEVHFPPPAGALGVESALGSAGGGGLGTWADALAFEGRSEEWGLLRFALRPPPRAPPVGDTVVFRQADSEVRWPNIP